VRPSSLGAAAIADGDHVPPTRAGIAGRHRGVRETGGRLDQGIEYGAATCARADAGRLGSRRRGWGHPIRPLAPDWKLAAKYFAGLLIVSYVLLKLIVYFTRVLAYYFLYGTWKFF